MSKGKHSIAIGMGVEMAVKFAPIPRTPNRKIAIEMDMVMLVIPVPMMQILSKETAIKME